jgi:hypothetical protein
MKSPFATATNTTGATTQNLPYGIEPDEVAPDYKNHGGWQEDLTWCHAGVRVARILDKLHRHGRKRNGDTDFHRLSRPGSGAND